PGRVLGHRGRLHPRDLARGRRDDDPGRGGRHAAEPDDEPARARRDDHRVHRAGGSSRLLNFAAMRVRRLVWQAFPMNFGIQTNRSERVARREGAHSMRFAASSRSSLRYRTQYSRHSDEIRGGHRQLEVLIDLPESPVDGLPDAPDRFAPAEVLLDALALHLTEPVALMTGRSAVDGAAPIPGVVV